MQRAAGWLRWIGPLAALFIFSLVVYVLHRELAHLHLRDVFDRLNAIPPEALAAAVAFTGASYLAVSCYDVLALRYLRRRVPYRRVLRTNFIATAFGYNLGFAMLTGAAFRLRLYASSGLGATEVATIAGFSSLTSTLGLASLAGLSLVFKSGSGASALHTHPGWSVPVGMALLAGVAAYWTWLPRPISSGRAKPSGTPPARSRTPRSRATSICSSAIRARPS